MFKPQESSTVYCRPWLSSLKNWWNRSFKGLFIFILLCFEAVMLQIECLSQFSFIYSDGWQWSACCSVSCSNFLQIIKNINKRFNSHKLSSTIFFQLHVYYRPYKPFNSTYFVVLLLCELLSVKADTITNL